MALTLANGEKIVKQYDYSKSIAGKGKGLLTESRLIVTNKRIIEEKVCATKRNEKIIRNEIPLEKAKKVSSSFRRKGNALWAILAGLSALVMIAGFAGGIMGLGVIGFAAMIVFALIFIFLRKSVVKVTISTDSIINPALMVQSATQRRLSARQIDLYTEVVKVMVDPAVAMQMVDEIGATILDAKNAQEE